MKTIIQKKEQIYQGNLILVNAQYAYREDKTCVRVNVQGETLLREAAHSLNALMEKLGGWEQIAAVSGWRSMEEQQTIWDESMEENGESFTRKYVAVPGHSEHQTGLAMDLGFRQGEIDFIRPAFPYDGICQAFRERAAEYGFVERYPAGKEQVTGIGHEPWHFRYVGTPHAQIMKQEGMVLEEYIPFLRRFAHGINPYQTETGGRKTWISFQKAKQQGATEIKTDESMEVSISGNNVDGFIITQQRKR